MRRAIDPIFSGIQRPESDFKRVRDDMATPLLSFDLDLTSARTLAAGTAATIDIAGNFLAIDQRADVGNALVTFQDDAFSARPAQVYMQTGSKAKLPFTRLLIENAAQPGKYLRIVYGVDVDFDPSPTANVTISGNINVLPALDVQGATLDRGFIYGATFQNFTAQALNTALQVFAPGSNINGAILWDAACAYQSAGAAGTWAMLAKTSAPVGVTDGDCIMGPSSFVFDGARLGPVGRLMSARRIPAGKGLYFFNSTAESAGHKSAIYTLL